MTLDDFIARVPASTRSKVSERTLDVWHAIYSYVVEHGQVDRFDYAFEKSLATTLGKWFSGATLQRHLRGMSKAGLLQPHRVIVRYTEHGKLWLPFGRRMFRDDALSAGAFVRYTLPGMKPTLDTKQTDEQPTKA